MASATSILRLLLLSELRSFDINNDISQYYSSHPQNHENNKKLTIIHKNTKQRTNTLIVIHKKLR